MTAADSELALSTWATLAALAAPHLLYAFIWFNAGTWQRWFGKQACEWFERVAWALKALQFSSVVYWYLQHGGRLQLSAIHPLAALLAVALGGAGQALNVGIFRAIGHAGVYYGFKLGHTIPWVDGFPFNVVSHPQYVGSVLSVWAAAALVWTQAPSGLAWLAIYWTGLYVITAWQESWC